MNVNNIYDSIKDLLEVNAISEKYNRDVLAGTKYRVLGDIAIVYFINADNRDLGEVMKAIPVLNAISLKPITVVLFPSSSWTKMERRFCGADIIVMIGLLTGIRSLGANSYPKMTNLS